MRSRLYRFLFSYTTPFGPGLFVFQEGVVQRIFLPGSFQHLIPVDPVNDGTQGFISLELSGVFDGRPADGVVSLLNTRRLRPFSGRVLKAVAGVPRGTVVTYGELAGLLERPGGARAVGNALAANPFPLAVPCHRIVPSRNPPGEYQGGLSMKRFLLKAEGVEF